MRPTVFLAMYLIAIAAIASVSMYLDAYTGESLTFEYCEFTDSYGFFFICIAIRNNGTKGVIVVDYVVNQTSILHGNPYCGRIEEGELEQPGLPYNWSLGHYYTITAVTARGARFSITEKAVSAETLLTVDNVSWNTASNTTNIVIRNTGVRTRRIAVLYLGTEACHFQDVTCWTDLADGRLLGVGQSTEIILEWPNPLGLSWTGNRTYYFSINPDTGMNKMFNSTAPL